MDWWTYHAVDRLLRIEHARAPDGLRIVEIGSYQVRNRWCYLGVPGHHRDLLRRSDTVLGIDAVPGPGVDLVADACDLPCRTQAYDLGIASSVLEHCVAPVPVLAELLRVARRAIVVVPWLYPHHAVEGHYGDYWRASPMGVAAWATAAGGHCVSAGWAGPHTWAVMEAYR